QLSEPGYYGVGMAFLPKDKKINQVCRQLIKDAAENRGMEFLGFRQVPVNPEGIGPTALSVEPDIVQFFVSRPANVTNINDFERKLYVLRQLIVNKTGAEMSSEDVYIASL